MDVEKYLARIGISSDIPRVPTYEFLKELQLAHLYSVPYENIDIINGVPINLEIEKIYEKIVVGRRGGWCFELNCLFSALLFELGFNTKNYLARFWRGEEGIPIHRHRVTAVFVNGKTYISDVGIGSVSPRIPLLLEPGLVQEYFGESYRFEKEADFGWVLYEFRHGVWERYFSFTDEPHYDADFVAISYFCEHHFTSKFNKSYIVALKTKTGRKCVDGHDFKEFSGNELIRTEENMSEERTRELFFGEFGLKV